MGHIPIISGTKDQLYIDEPIDLTYTTQEDETGNDIRFNLVASDGTVTEFDTLTSVSDGAVGTDLTVTKDPTDDLGLTTQGYYTVQVIRNPSGSDDTLDQARIYLHTRE